MATSARITRADFAKMRTHASRRIAGDFFTLVVAPHAGSKPKSTCVVSKKVAVRAVDRNLIKRRCRAVVQAQVRGVEEPLVLVFQAKKGILEQSFAAIRDDIKKLLKRALAA